MNGSFYLRAVDFYEVMYYALASSERGIIGETVPEPIAPPPVDHSALPISAIVMRPIGSSLNSF